ncbi:MAG: DUF1570 domain-containing protein [Planctomycetota bacterium]|nr:DUF1570 domain-containing protein [Planctomycetota bacterium]MDA1180618.1 DUF1570 domain-containing protein [Planctomycetota bacterium]
MTSLVYVFILFGQLLVSSSACFGINSASLTDRRQVLRAKLVEQAELLFAESPDDAKVRAALDAWSLPYRTVRRAILLPVVDPTFEGVVSVLQKSSSGNEWEKLRRQHSEQICELLNECRDAAELAAELALEALREDPSSVIARQCLSQSLPNYPLRGDVIREQRGTAPEKQLGWVPGAYWRVRSNHFLLVTNAEARFGREMVETLEQLYAVAQPLLLTRSQGDSHRRHKPMRIVLFTSRQQYLDYLQSEIPQIASTVGYYDPRQRTSYFYLGSGDDPQSTLLHEATHQILHELWNPQHAVGETSDFWIVEGIALYFESCLFGAASAGVGGVDTDRLQFARYRGLRETLPSFETLCRLGRADFQQHPDLPKIYTQVAGFTHFLMDGNHGAYRSDFLKYLSAVYESDQPGFGTWQAASNRPWSEWAVAYQEYLKLNEGALHRLWPRSSRRLCLGLTRLSRRDLEDVAEYGNLEWLDMANLPVDDDLLVARLGSQPKLRQLNLEGTQVSGRSLSQVFRWQTLEELDLSGLPISDADLTAVEGHLPLKVLWLTNTRLTDASVNVIAKFTKLETIGLQGTQITAAGVDRLKVLLPTAEIHPP